MDRDRWERVKRIFSAVVESEPAVRSSRLGDLCGNDGELRREVENLLEAHHKAGSFLESPWDPPRALTPGTMLSHFQIGGELGQGGMGTVYRARDTRLGREVAVKVLPERFGADPERVARFEREAHVLASLNHPNIAAIYEVGEASPRSAASKEKFAEDLASADSTVHYLVMELVEGEDLAKLLGSGALPFEQRLEVGIEIARALEAAHAHGVVHRDLKPANVKRTPEGEVKVLDFGLAKALDPEGDDGDCAHGSNDEVTRAGTILGTASYMSPEQARGETVDSRSDVWSFGVVLWEMLCGQRPFDEETFSDTVASVLRTDPDFSRLPADLPRDLRRLLGRCLQKDRSERLHHIADARLELEAVLRGEDVSEPVAAPERGGSKPPLLWKLALGTGILLALVFAGVSAWFLQREAGGESDRQPVRFAIDRPEPYIDGSGPGLAVSPDGTRVAYRARNEAGVPQIFLRRLDRVEATPVVGTEGATSPFFSPDGERLGFVSGVGIYSVSIYGGGPELLVEVENFKGADWAPDGTLWYSPDQAGGLWRLSADGSDAEQMTFPDAERGERTHRWPMVLPGGDIVLFSVGTAEISSFDEARIDALRPSTGERRTLVEGGMYPRYLPPRYLLYGTAGSLMGIPFDERRLAVSGAATPLVEGLKTLPHSGLAAVAVAPDGSLLAGLGEPLRGGRRLVVYDRNGTVDSLTDEIRPYLRLALSPDESTVALEINGANASVWLLDLERDIQTRLTTRWSHNVPVWSPDSNVLVTSSSRGDTYRIHRHEIETGRSEVLHESRQLQFFASSWSVDGNLAVTVIPIGEDPDIWIVPVADPSRGEPLVASPYLDQGAQFSPDGRWVAFVSNESGRDEIYIVPSDGTGAKVRVSPHGGQFPVWNRRGDEIVFYDGSFLSAVAVEASERLRIGNPRALFRPDPELFDGSFKTFDITAGGRLLSFHQAEVERELAMDLVFTRHWIEELRPKLLRR